MIANQGKQTNSQAEVCKPEGAKWSVPACQSKVECANQPEQTEMATLHTPVQVAHPHAPCTPPCTTYTLNIPVHLAHPCVHPVYHPAHPHAPHVSCTPRTPTSASPHTLPQCPRPPGSLFCLLLTLGTVSVPKFSDTAQDLCRLSCSELGTGEDPQRPPHLPFQQFCRG